jgi:hypothetical protein
MKNNSKVGDKQNNSPSDFSKYPKLRPLPNRLNMSKTAKNHTFSKEYVNDGKLVVYLTGNQLEQLLKQRAVIYTSAQDPPGEHNFSDFKNRRFDV